MPAYKKHFIVGSQDGKKVLDIMSFERMQKLKKETLVIFDIDESKSLERKDFRQYEIADYQKKDAIPCWIRLAMKKFGRKKLLKPLYFQKPKIT